MVMLRQMYRITMPYSRAMPYAYATPTSSRRAWGTIQEGFGAFQYVQSVNIASTMPPPAPTM